MSELNTGDLRAGDFQDLEHQEFLNGTELYFEQVGPKSGPSSAPNSKTTVVYLHGGPGYNSYSFRSIIGEELERYPMIYLDQRGSGRSSPLEGDLNIDTLTDDLEAVREFLKLERIIPLGHGFGAVVALEYARRFPQYTEKVIVVNPWLQMPELAFEMLHHASKAAGEVFKDPKADVLEKTPEGEFPMVGTARVEQAFDLYSAYKLLNQMQFQDDRSRLRLEFADVESQLLGGAEVQGSLVAQGLWEFEYLPFLLEVKRPIWVISGVHDQTSYPNQADPLIDLAGAEILELEAAHYPWIDDSEAFVEALERAIQG